MYTYCSGDIFSSKHGIFVRNDDKILYSAIILANGGGTSIHEQSYYIGNDTIIICCGDTLFSLTLLELKLNWKIKIDDVTAFAIYKMNNDYIIHGGLAISRVNNDGKIIWQQYGSDIFVTAEDVPFYFDIIDNYIYTISWDGRKYKFNYDNGEGE
jgi:outer membrane protein assembly factor BamB